MQAHEKASKWSVECGIQWEYFISEALYDIRALSINS